MLLSVEKKFIFIHIPKTAGSSLKRALAPYALNPQRSQYRRLLSHLPVPESPERAWLRQHDKAAWIRLKLPRSVFESYHKFAVVRNPYDYAVSYYAYVRGNDRSRANRHAQGTFLEFLNYLRRKDAISGITQSSWIVDAKGSLIIDQILRFETLDVDFAELSARLGLEASLPHVNRSERGDYRAMYGEEERDLADRLFARDLELLGYNFNGPTGGSGAP
jgi:hypothetical protein